MRGAVRVLGLVILAGLLQAPTAGFAAGAETCDPETAWSAEAALREALDLWKDGRYEALHGRGYLEQQAALPLDVFARLLRREDRVPQCCWLTLRRVSATCDGERVYLRGIVGYEVAGYLFDPARRAWAHDTGARDVEEVWPVGWQAGAWRVDLYQVLGPSLYYWEQAPGVVRRFDFPRFPRPRAGRSE
jgi:hypothetical protein